MDIDLFNTLNALEQYHHVSSMLSSTTTIRTHMSMFMGATGQYGRLRQYNNYDYNRIVEDCRSPFLSTISREAANLTYAQLWSNDNESIVLGGVPKDNYDKFITWLNTTNLSVTLSLVIKDYLDFGCAFVYVEEVKEKPYVYFRLINPLCTAWAPRDAAFFYLQNKYDKTTKTIKKYVHVIMPDVSYCLDESGHRRESTLKYSSFLAIKTDNVDDLDGVGIGLMRTVSDMDCTVRAYRHHMEMMIRPPVILNAHSVTEDAEIDLEPSGVTMSSEHYSGQAQSPIAMVLDKYQNILQDIQVYLEQSRNDIKQAYRLDMLQSPDPRMQSNAFQVIRSQLYYLFIPRMVNVLSKLANRKVDIDLGNDYVLKLDTLANNASTASKANNMTEFLNLVGMIEKVSGGSGLKLNPSKLIEEIGSMLKIDPYVLFSEQDMAHILKQVAAANNAQQRPQQAPPQQLQPGPV